jgi:DNA modification methylase
LLLHGDCLDLLPTLEAGSIDMVLCDLPYGTTANKWDAVIPFPDLWEAYQRVCKPNAAIVLTAAQPFTSALVMSNPQWFRYDWVWRKPNGTGHLNAKKQPMRDKEDVLVFYRQQATYNPQFGEGTPYTSITGPQSSNYGKFNRVLTVNDGRRYPKQVLEFNCDHGHHPTQKPVALMEYLIRTYTNSGDTVLDNTMGSGTTGVACVNTGRQFIGIERDDAYFAIAERRIREAQPALVV